ncbi:pyridoxal phosphate-dependent aminotransferase [Donghicola eburneus]|uniref:Aminotransferase n=1 Tax=Donghicola eburneus TaxID=393278 RepID=A0A1M4MX45_9RHOB|nr:pyridoxal phosphate-dependent aminotransferase [Donghicola eburneus]SCM67080.1 histidinol-phosphate aminotransferase [Donghicola eburneus]SFQ72192.1 histidinol-phosphate aminotransferase [Donghicola eburneus]
MTHPRYTRLLDSLPSTVPFVGPEVIERTTGQPFSARLGANENIFGPSPTALEALRQADAEIWKYPDSASHDLKSEIAAQNGIAPENIVIGEGVDGLLGYLARMMIEQGDTVVTSDGAYPTFNYHVAGFGGVLHKVPFKDDFEDLDALITRAAEVDAKLLYLSNPDNPMGTYLSGTTIADALDRLPKGCLMILDEAYIELAPTDARADIAIEDPRVIRMRSMSKAYGLAGARVGYALGAAELIKNFDKIRNHFGLNRSAQHAALAALQDTEWLAHIQSQVSHSRDRLSQIALDNSLTPIPSATNFVTMDCGRDGDYAAAVVRELGARGIFARMPGVAPLNRCIRISCGPDAALDLFAAALPQALKAAL